MSTPVSRGDRPVSEPVAAAPRRAEVLAALSLAIDLGLGQPMEHMLCATILSMRLADVLGLDDEQRTSAYYANLVAWVGCNADSHEVAAYFGDDIRFRADSYSVDWSGLPVIRLFLEHLAAGEPALRRGARQAAFLVTGRFAVAKLIRSHCISAGMLADHLGLPPTVRTTVQHVFERWDGTGLPDGARGAAIPLPIRVMQVADVVEVHLRERGPAAAGNVVRERSGTQFDPAVADALLSLGEAGLAGLRPGDAWDAALDLAPDRDALLAGDTLDEVLRAIGDFADLKSPFTAGHSRSVADLAAAAARGCGLPPPQVHELWRAGLVHDLGRMGISNALWDRAGPLTVAEIERVRLHPYLTERILGRVPRPGPHRPDRRRPSRADRRIRLPARRHRRGAERAAAPAGRRGHLLCAARAATAPPSELGSGRRTPSPRRSARRTPRPPGRGRRPHRRRPRRRTARALAGRTDRP